MASDLNKGPEINVRSGLLLMLTLVAMLPGRVPCLLAGNDDTGSHSRHFEAAFIANHGQWDDDVSYVTSSPGMNIWLAGNTLVYDHFRNSLVPGAATVPAHEAGERRGHVLRMEFVGGDPAAAPIADEVLPGYYNYFRGGEHARSVTRVPRYRSLRLRELYPGIDLKLYFQEKRPRYDLIVQPLADPSVIRFSVSGADSIAIDAEGVLRLNTSVGTIHHAELFAYQHKDHTDDKVKIACSFALSEDGSIRFDLGSYDEERPLIIDPLIFSTFVGGADNEEPFDIVGRRTKGAFITGATPSLNYPVTPGSYVDSKISKDLDVFVSQLHPNGGALVFSSFIQGADEEVGKALALTAEGDILIGGHTRSADFPITRQAHQGDFSLLGGQACFITLMRSDGAELLYSSYFGGRGEETINAMAISPDGLLFCAGETSSQNFTRMDRSLIQSVNRGRGDGFLLQLLYLRSTLNLLPVQQGTYLGGSQNDRINAIALDGSKNVYLTGATSSSDFPATPSSTAGKEDIFVTKIKFDLTGIEYSYLYGGVQEDEGVAIAVNGANEAYVAGHNHAGDFPITANAAYANPSEDENALLLKLPASGTPAVYASYFGSRNDGAPSWTEINDLAVDGEGNVYFTGFTLSRSLEVTPDAQQTESKGDPGDSFLGMVSGATPPQILYLSYFGGNERDEGIALDVRGAGDVFLLGSTRSAGSSFTTSEGAYQEEQGGGTDAFVARFKLSVDLKYPVGDEVICAGDTVNIEWVPTQRVDRIRLALWSAKEGAIVDTIAANTSASVSQFRWVVPRVAEGGQLYQVQILNVTSATILDRSPRLFSINLPPLVTEQPTAALVCLGAVSGLSAAAEGFPTPRLAKWQESIIGAPGTWRDIGPDPPRVVSERNHMLHYRACFENECGIVYSQAAQLLIEETPVLRIEGSGLRRLCAGESLTLRSTVGDAGKGSYFWEIDSNTVGAPDEFHPINGANDDQYTIVGASKRIHGYRYRLRYVTPSGCTVYSNAVTLQIHGAPVISRQPGSRIACADEAAEFSIGYRSPTGADVQIRWQRRSGAADDWEDITDPGANDTLRIDPVRTSDHGTQIRAALLACDETIYSDVAVLNVLSAALLSVDPPGGLDFGRLDECEGSSMATLTLRNRNVATLSILEALSTDPAFEVLTQLPREIASGGSTTIRLRYNPSDEVNSGVLTLRFKECSFTLDIDLKGAKTGSAPVTLPATLDFGIIPSCQEAAEAEVAIYNRTGIDLRIEGVQTLAPFAIGSSLPATPITLADQDRLIIPVLYQPQSDDSHNSAVAIAISSERCPVIDTLFVPLSGERAAVGLETEPSAFVFSAFDCEDSWDSTLTLRNSGSFPLDLRFTAEPLNAVSVSPDEATLPPGEELVVNISADLRLSSNPSLVVDYGICDRRELISLSGTLIASGPLLVEESLDFGNLRRGGSLQRSLRIDNQSGGVYRITGINSPDAPFTLLTALDLPHIIEANDGLDLELTFTAAEVGQHSSEIVLILAGPCGEREHRIALTGSSDASAYIQLRIDDYRQKLGDRFDVAVHIDSTAGFTDLGVERYALELAYNATILGTTDESIASSFSDGEQRIVIEGSYDPLQTGPLFLVPMRCGWGNAQMTSINIVSARFFGNDGRELIEVDVLPPDNGSLTLTDILDRMLINPAPGALLLRIKQNPAEGDLRIVVSGLGRLAGLLEIFDFEGRSLFAQPVAADGDVIVAATSIPASGSYFCRVSSGERIVVRSFVYRK